VQTQGHEFHLFLVFGPGYIPPQTQVFFPEGDPLGLFLGHLNQGLGQRIDYRFIHALRSI
jgi:hypothetical protein